MVFLVLPLALLLILSGCASYYNHYTVFPAANSKGEARKVKVSWQTEEYPDWWFAANQATPITLVTQCSTRRWQLTDAGQRAAGESCGEGILACGEPGVDQRRGGIALAQPQPCMTITDPAGAERIAELGRELELTVSCLPVEVQRQAGDEMENRDYLRASVVPYQLRVRKAPRGSFTARPPELDDSVCDDQ